MQASEPSDTSDEAARVHAASIARMDGFQRLALAASLRRRAMRMLALQYESRADIVLHMLRGRIDQAAESEIRRLATETAGRANKS
ncbi:MAG: hypothetical protein HS108_07010 [Planctomycetes bacterium]|nr:hypothetical protein [Planctomycetota bacterium]MCL4729666.1 hypothetical protein [Planctomycetota bacterium]